jgi:hypothetical protein
MERATRRLGEFSLGLLIMTGFMMVLCALPTGLLAASRFTPDWYWALIAFLVTTSSVAVVGGLFVGLGSLLNRNHKSR